MVSYFTLLVQLVKTTIKQFNYISSDSVLLYGFPIIQRYKGKLSVLASSVNRDFSITGQLTRAN